MYFTVETFAQSKQEILAVIHLRGVEVYITALYVTM
jgi:hypothetical protein